MPSESIDLVLTDPPYGIDFQSNRRTKSPKFPRMENDSDLGWLPEFVEQSFRILKPNRHIYSFCRWDILGKFQVALEARFKLKNCLVWYKPRGSMGDLDGAFQPCHEFILFGVKGKRDIIGHRSRDVMESPAIHSHDYLHPTQKPTDLLKFLLSKAARPGEIVLDPFAGSGSTCVAADESGFQWIGIELEGYYVDISRRRMKNITPIFDFTEETDHVN